LDVLATCGWEMDLYEFDSFKFDAKTRMLFREGKPVPLTPKAADLLLVFLKKPEQVLLKDELLEEVWPDKEVEERNLNLNVHYLKKALGKRDGGKEYFENFPRRGYLFTAPVTRVSPDSEATALTIKLDRIPAEEEIPVSHHESIAADKLRSAPVRWPTLGVLGTISLLALAAGGFVLWDRPASRLRVENYTQLTHDARDKGSALLTDGQRVYFEEKGTEGPQLALVGVEGGTAGTLPLQLQDTAVLDIAPLRSEVLAVRHHVVGAGGEVWVLPLFGGSPRRVGALKADWATWSSDKTRVASALGPSIFISNADGAGLRKIATTFGEVSRLGWSPDEKTLRFTIETYENGDVQYSLWEVNVDGTSLRPLLPGWHDPHQECCGSWSPDGNLYVFQHVRDGHSELWAIPERQPLFGRRVFAPVRRSSDLIDLSGSAAIGSDGKHIFAAGMKPQGELVRFDSSVHDFVKFLGGISATWVTFAKSGQSVAYIGYPDLTIWRAKADGSEKKQITFAPLQAEALSWSPNEKWLATRARTPGNPWKIYLIPSQGGEPQPLTPSEKEQGDPTWSSDGTRLCFGDVPAIFGNPVGTESIHIFDLQTHKLSDLPGSQGLWTSRWSPDGRYIAALTIQGQKLKLFDLSANSWRSTNAARVNTPNWSADSKYIYYDTEPSVGSLQRLTVADGSVDQLVNLRDYRPLAAWWSGLSPNNDPLVLRNLGSTEIYSLSLEYR